MDVGAYSSQNIMNQYLSNAQSRTVNERQDGLLRAERSTAADKAQAKDDNAATPTAKETDKHLLPGQTNPTRINPTNPADETEDSQAQAAEEQEVRELQARDSEVRSHEAAHKAAGGQYAGSASFEYESGPDGHMYAVSGEVDIDISSESTPEETIAKMQRVRAAALAPASPSAQDRSVAAAASSKSMQATREMHAEKKTEAGEHNETTGLQNAGKNRQIKEYERNDNIIKDLSPAGQENIAADFQEIGTLKADEQRHIATYA